VDSSSVKSTPLAGPRGFDGAKKIDGIKRHILVDTAGRLLAVHATAANVQDRAAFADLLTKNPCPTVTHVWADKGYTGQTPTDAATAAGIELEIVSGPKPVGGFVVQPRRWVVERTNG
jgi:transposase